MLPKRYSFRSAQPFQSILEKISICNLSEMLLKWLCSSETVLSWTILTVPGASETVPFSKFFVSDPIFIPEKLLILLLAIYVYCSDVGT